MSATAVSGKLYTGSITSASGSSGTLISNVEAREYALRVGQRVAHFRTGFSPDAIEGIFIGLSSTVFIFRGRDVGSDTIALMFSEIDNSGGIAGDGTGVKDLYALATKTALIVRPNDTNKRTLYIPNAQLAGDDVLELLYSERGQHLADNEVALVPSRAAGNTEPAFAYDTAANVNSLYAGLT